MTWIEDGTGEFVVDGNKITCGVTPTQSSTFNAMWKEGSGMASGVKAWKLTSNASHMQFGVTTEEKFLPGWKCRGMLYNGNLSDGGGLLESNYGPGIKAGDEVVMVVDMSGESLKVSYQQNSKNLGVAFDIPKPFPTGLYPLIGFSTGQGESASIEKCDVPADMIKTESTPTGLNGAFKIVADSVKGADGAAVAIAFPDAVVALEDGGATLNIRSKVVNQCSFRAAKEGDVYNVGGGASTMMMGPEPMMETERAINALLGGATSFTVNGERLEVSGAAGSAAFTRTAPEGAKTVTKNPLDRS